MSLGKFVGLGITYILPHFLDLTSQVANNRVSHRELDRQTQDQTGREFRILNMDYISGYCRSQQAC